MSDTNLVIPALARLKHILSHREDRKTVRVAPLTIYFDDSGTHPQGPIAVAAGWVAPVEQWQRFTEEWHKTGEEEGFAKFHMAPCMANNPRSHFADLNVWNESKKRRVCRRLREIIRQTIRENGKGFAIAVQKRDYDELVVGELRGEAGEHHYTWAVRLVIGYVETWRKTCGITEPIEYIFDRMSGGKKEIELVFEQAESGSDALHRYGIYKGYHSFRDAAEILPLQAADMLAWCVYQRSQAHNHGKAGNPIAVETFNYFLNECNLLVGMQTKDQLAEWVQKGPFLVGPRKPG